MDAAAMSAIASTQPIDDRERLGLRRMERTTSASLPNVVVELPQDGDEDEDEDKNTIDEFIVGEEFAKSSLLRSNMSEKHKMHSPEGKGVADRTPSQEKTGKRKTELTDMGKEFPGKHHETAAMCDVDENGVENEPQGVHVSKHADAEDGHSKALGHDWPKEPKNHGGASEPFKEWTVSNIGKVIGGDTVNVQALFNQYAKAVDYVCLEEFDEIVKANGSDVVLDEASLESLMAANKDYMFYERSDASGRYWLPINEAFEGEEDEESEEHEEHEEDEEGHGEEHEEGESHEEEHAEHMFGGEEDEEHEFDEMDDEEEEECDEEPCDEDDYPNIGMSHDVEDHEFDEIGSEEEEPVLNINININTEGEVGVDHEEMPINEMPRHGEDEEDHEGMATESAKMRGRRLNEASRVCKNTKMVKVGDAWKRKPKNKSGETPVMPNPPAKLTGKTAVESNVKKLAMYVKNSILESARTLPHQKYGLTFTVVVTEGKGMKKKKCRTKKCDQFSEALCNAEELIQIHGKDNVGMEASFTNGKGQVILTRAIPMIAISSRTPIMAEGKVLFRFNKHAEAFASRLVSEGITCTVNKHNWGAAVKAPIGPEKAKKVFWSITG